MPPLYVAQREMMERAIRHAIGPHGTYACWSTGGEDADPTWPNVGAALYGFGPSHVEAGVVLWVVFSKTYTEPKDGVRLDALTSAADVDELPARFVDNDRALLELWISLGLGDALRAAFRQRAQA